MSRKLAEKILMLEMSINTTEHIEKISYLKSWIVDAMLEYHSQKLVLIILDNKTIEAAKEMQDLIVKNQPNLKSNKQ